MLVRKVRNIATNKIMYIDINKLIKENKLPLGYEFTEAGLWFDDYLLNEEERKYIL